MNDRSAASVGFVLAGVILALAFEPWPGGRGLLIAGLAGVALVALGLRRYGALEPAVGAPVASFGGIAVALIGLATFVEPAIGSASTIQLFPAFTTITGILLAVFAYADWLGYDRSRLIQMTVATATSTAIGVSGLLAIVVWSAVIASGLQAAAGDSVGPSIRTALATLALGLGTGTVAAIYLYIGNKSLDYIDFRYPSIREFAFMLGGAVVLVALNLGIGFLFERIGLKSARHSIIRTAESNPEILLVLIPLAYLIIGPGEELLYRNIIQKSLYEHFSRPAAIIVASAIFAGVHVFAFSGGSESLLATLNTLTVVFVLSLVLGIVYERTDNIIVPAIVHASFDAIAFTVTYLQLTGAV